ncbi:hypothetical protein FH972_001379 [Carpinus fangiana]|uniref:Uncharacterized protein n=1 Tax=Carpinus fangiana TaxID=176857 RepID=A0A5N6QBJ0_9ROSI|nr:hypothetical protein FH972_001379 [Carpinus fangiana]
MFSALPPSAASHPWPSRAPRKDRGCETTRGSPGYPFLGGHRSAEPASAMAGRPFRP